jgi:hypothetical protein
MQSKKTLVSVALAGMFSCSGAFAAPSSGDEAMPSSGYRGWGPMANLETPYSPNESASPRYDVEMRDRAEHVAEVSTARDQVWVANAALRESDDGRNMVAAKPSMLLEPFRQLARMINWHSDR